MRQDASSRPTPGLCPFHDTAVQLTDGGEEAELISSSIDSIPSIEEIDLPISKGQVRGECRPSPAAQRTLPCLSAGQLAQTRVAKALNQQTVWHLGGTL